MMDMNTPSGRIQLQPLCNFREHAPIQRKSNPGHIAKLASEWQWDYAGVITVHSWKSQISKYLSPQEVRKLDFDLNTAVHPSNGLHRIQACRLLFPTGFFEEEHAARNLIPPGFYIKMPVMLTSQLVTYDPIETFIKVNTVNKVTDGEKFAVRVGGGQTDAVSLFRLFTKEYHINVTFGDYCVKGAKNTTGAAHIFYDIWKKNPDCVRNTLNIITTAYNDNGTIDPTALSHSFMMGLAYALKELTPKYSITNITKALARLKAGGWSALAIGRHCQGTGGGVARRKTRELLAYLVNYYMDRRRSPKAHEIDCLNLKFHKLGD